MSQPNESTPQPGTGPRLPDQSRFDRKCGQLYAALRTMQGLQQVDIVARLRRPTSLQTLSMLENGKRQWTSLRLVDLLLALPHPVSPTTFLARVCIDLGAPVPAAWTKLEMIKLPQPANPDDAWRNKGDVWVPEAPKYSGVYAPYGDVPPHVTCVHNIFNALQFRTEPECAAWCHDHPVPEFVPRMHGFAQRPKVPPEASRLIRAAFPDIFGHQGAAE